MDEFGAIGAIVVLVALALAVGFSVTQSNEKRELCRTSCLPYTYRVIDRDCYCMDPEQRWVRKDD